MDEGHVVDASGKMRDEFADPLAALTVLLPPPGALHYGPRVALEKLNFVAGVEPLAVTLDEVGFVVEGIALAGSAGHEELTPALRACRMVKAAVELDRAFAPSHPLRTRPLRAEEFVKAQQVGQCDPAEAAAET